MPTKKTTTKKATPKNATTKRAEATVRTMSPAFNKVVTVLARSEGVEPPNPEGRGFGSCALKVRGKIFAMEIRGALVVKLSKARVESLVSDGTGSYFDPGHGRLMKQWVSVEPDAAPWLELAKEAYAFVR